MLWAGVGGRLGGRVRGDDGGGDPDWEGRLLPGPHPAVQHVPRLYWVGACVRFWMDGLCRWLVRGFVVRGFVCLCVWEGGGGDDADGQNSTRTPMPTAETNTPSLTPLSTHPPTHSHCCSCSSWSAATVRLTPSSTHPLPPLLLLLPHPIVHPPTIFAFLRCDRETFRRVSLYLDFIRRRGMGETMTTAAWMRKFVTTHLEYKVTDSLGGWVGGWVGACAFLGERHVWFDV